MASKTVAELTTENNASIVGASAPDFITPTTLGTMIQDLIDSMYNKEDDPAPATSDGVTVQSMAVPDVFDGIVDNGDTLTQWLQAIANRIDILNETMAIQGTPGCFLAHKTDSTRQLVGCAAGGLATNLICANDETDGGFDNGNNWGTFSYVVPVGGFTGRFVLSDIEIELIAFSDNSDFMSVTFQPQLNGTNFGSSMVLNIPGGSSVSHKVYSASLVSPALTSGPTTWVDGDVITVKVTPSATGSAAGTVAINTACFSNQDL